MPPYFFLINSNKILISLSHSFIKFMSTTPSSPHPTQEMAALRTRTKSIKQTSEGSETIDEQVLLIEKPPLPTPPSLPKRTITQTLASTANLANLLPTGTVLAFQLLVPTFTNNGSCDAITRLLTHLLLTLLAASCFLASFTDSIKSTQGKVYYGVVTFKGLWLFDCDLAESLTLPDLKKYKMRFIDGVHAVLSVLVFVVVALRDKNVVSCFYPLQTQETQKVLNITTMGIGVICSLLFVAFPTKRHGIGYPVSSGI